MFKTSRKPVPVSVVGTYPTREAASRQVDLLFMRNHDLNACVNIVPSENGTGYTVQAVKWQ